jgi:cobalt-precorrin-5B (C1)-methyltransferase
MFDPVNNFHIPDEWINRAKIPPKELKERIESGRYILLSNGSMLRRGYTTGTTAAASAKASVLSMNSKKPEILEISVPTPSGLRAILSVSADRGKAIARKDSGDHANDVTNGIEIAAEAVRSDTIIIKAGNGIGIQKGKAAINPCPMRQIEEAIKEALSETGLAGACVTLSVPEGKEIAKKTLNKKIGIVDGISILGTTGFVEPWNEHLGEMKEELIRAADKIVLTTGRLGMRYSCMLFPDYTVILIGSDISRGLEAALSKRNVIICGLSGLILKWADPDILKNSAYQTVQEMIDDKKQSTIDVTTKKSGRRVVLLKRDGTILRDSGEP